MQSCYQGDRGNQCTALRAGRVCSPIGLAIQGWPHAWLRRVFRVCLQLGVTNLDNHGN
jgi:hypothetical protein